MTSSHSDIKTGHRYRHTMSGHTIVVVGNDTADGGSGTIQFRMDEFFGVHVIDESSFVREYEPVITEAGEA